MPFDDPEVAAALEGASDEERAHVIALARHESWHRGDIRFKLDCDQREDFAVIWPNFAEPGSRPTTDVIAAISRQRGKSFLACATATMFCLRFPFTSVKYASKTQKSVYSIVEPQFRTILADCPDELRPNFDRMRGVWSFQNGANVTVAGTDNKHYENLRGTSSHLNIKDEAGFFDDYEEVDAVLAPQLLTTGGVTLEISTPPESAGHPFEQRFHAASIQGRAIHRQIWNHPRMTEGEILFFLSKEADKRGMSLEEFKKTTYFRREFLAEFVTEETRAVVPGWSLERARESVVEVSRPPFFDAYVGLDLGFGDPHGGLFGWWDFPRQWLVIEDELLLRSANTLVLTEAMKAKEVALWGVDKFAGTLRGAKEIQDLPDYLREAAGDGAPLQPYLRVGDNDPLALADIQQNHRYTVLPTRKDDLHLQCDQVDVMVRRGQIKIHPRCTNLIQQLHTAIWNRTRTTFERNSLGHSDLVAALVYLVRNLRRHKDPRPVNWGVSPDDQYVRPKPPHPLKAAFGMVKRR